jgi:coenzyme F420-reducing hydrogenase delta subunit
MGLGKTIQTIGFLAYLHEKLQKQGPHLVVVPLSVLSNWISEIERFAPAFRTVRFHGPKSERDRIKEEEMKDLKEFDIVVTTYEILVSEINFFRRKFVWTSVIVDEGHRLKNEKSQFSEKLRCVPCISKIILTGTPLQNNLRELWALLFYLVPEIFTTSEKFDEGFDLLRGKIDNDILRKARKMLTVFMLRRLKEHVAIKLPSRKEVTLLVCLTNQQIELYKQLLCGLDSNTIEIVMREADQNDQALMSAVTTSNNNNNNNMSRTTSTAEMMIADMNDDQSPPSQPSSSINGQSLTVTKSTSNNNNNNNSNNNDHQTDSEWRKLMNILLQLRKICNHTYLLPNVAPFPYEITEEIVYGSGKLLMLDRMLPALKADGHRVLLFSQFTSMLDILEDYCELRDYAFVRLDGETNRVKRRLDVRRFNAANSSLFIFLISTRAGGFGLNLASADTVILYDSDWNPQVDLQAMERAHRIGQEKPVRVFRLICRGSVEERMISRAEKKLFLNAMVAEHDPDETLNEEGHPNNNNNNSNNSSQVNEDIMQALGIGGSTLSKGELASLIRFGANAVFEGENFAQHQISDEELDCLLERKGRDVVIPIDEKALLPTTSTSSTANATTTVQEDYTTNMNMSMNDRIDAFESAQVALRERVNHLKEIDLRQLGDIVYQKRKSTHKTSYLNEDLIIHEDTKRERKERIVMVSGKGTGYGGAVPILQENLYDDIPAGSNNGTVGLREEMMNMMKARGRQWHHRCLCTLCGRRILAAATIDGTNNESTLVTSSSTINNVSYNKCAHCPFIFHQSCGEQYNLFFKGSGLLICPHHRCCDCNRPTASAGGLLFRCISCLTAYCEDCLPQDEIESMGRCKALEEDGYYSKQAYYIKCPYCCNLEGVKPMGVLGDRDYREEQERQEQQEIKEQEEEEELAQLQQQENDANSNNNNKAMDVDTTNNNENGDNNGNENGTNDQQATIEDATPLQDPAEEMEEAIIPLPSQLMRIHWKEVIDPPKVSKAKGGKGGKGGRSKKRKSRNSMSSTVSSSSRGGRRASRSKEVVEEEIEENDDYNNDDDSDDNGPALKRAATLADGKKYIYIYI